MAKEINESFVFNQIRKFNQARRQTQKDVVLHAVGVHAGLVKVQRTPLPTLTPEERQRVLYFLRQFCEQQGVEVLLKE
jgi:hypothetical protein